VTSPNEPGYPRSADGPGSANGSPADSDTGVLGNAMGRDGGDAPPWQRGPAARAQQRRDPSRPEPRRASASNHPPGVDARLDRFISGGSSAPAAEAEPARSEPLVNEAYASELPDLSAASPRQAPRKATAERNEPAPTPRSPAQPARVQVASRTYSGPVRASMQIRRIDPWSALKVSLVLSVALFFVWMIGVAFLYLVLGGMGVWAKLNSNVGDLLTSASGQSGGELVSSGTIFGGAALIGLVNIVLLTAMATVGVFIYNLTTDLVGGIEVTLADRD
jgi:uncharacterized membrane protein YccC